MRMQTTENILSAIHKYGVERKPLERLYRQLFKQELYLTAYGKLYANRGSMTAGTTNQTVDGMSLDRINKLIELLKTEKFRWTPVRRTHIPKKDGSQRPLGIPTWENKLLQEVIRMMLEAYYEPRFSENSHGFRPNRGCHTALQQIRTNWKGTTWFIEGDISKCFDSFNHVKLIEILEKDINDGRFINLIRNLLGAGYLEEWKWNPTPSGTPQGGVISPLLANVYLNELDRFIETTLLPENNIGQKHQPNPEYTRYAYLKKCAKKENDRESFQFWDKLMRSVPSINTHDPEYRRLRYIRYADDFLLGYTGTKSEAEDIKARLATWIGNELKLELSQTKTVITHGSTDSARFLGYEIKATQNDSYRDSTGRRSLNAYISLYLPNDKLNDFISRYTKNGKAHHRSDRIINSDYDIVATYQAEYRGYVQYYQMATNLHKMNKLKRVMSISMLKTLACKHKSSVQKMAVKYKCTIETEQGEMSGFRVTVEREGKKPLVAQFGGIHLTTNNNPFSITDEIPRIWNNKRTELVQRLQADVCEMCESKEDVEVHHVRKLADLITRGRKERPLWVQQMAAFRRKTLVVCRECHNAIHAGRTRTEWN
jgi:group II intron reverse transcriptase/maturase